MALRRATARVGKPNPKRRRIMELMVILVVAGVLFFGGILFAVGCSVGRSYAQHELHYERNQRLVERVHRDRIEGEKKELALRLKESREDYYTLSSDVIQSPRLAKVLPLLRDDKSMPEAG
jgi:hypothetical protein